MLNIFRYSHVHVLMKITNIKVLKLNNLKLIWKFSNTRKHFKSKIFKKVKIVQ